MQYVKEGNGVKKKKQKRKIRLILPNELTELHGVNEEMKSSGECAEYKKTLEPDNKRSRIQSMLILRQQPSLAQKHRFKCVTLIYHIANNIWYHSFLFSEYAVIANTCSELLHMFTERHNNSEINLQKPFNIAFNLFRAFHQKHFTR